MSQFFKNRPIAKALVALGASCVPLYALSAMTGPSYVRLIEFKRKEERQALQAENSYDPNHWKIRLLNRFKHPLTSDGEAVEANFLKKIEHAEGKTPEGFEVDFKASKDQDAAEVQEEVDDIVETPDKETKETSPPLPEETSESGDEDSPVPANKAETPDTKESDQDAPEVTSETAKPTAQQKIHNTSEEDDKHGRNPVAENVNKDSNDTPSKHAPVAQTPVQDAGVEGGEVPPASAQSPVSSDKSTAPEETPSSGPTDPSESVAVPEGKDDKLDNAVEPVFEISEGGAPHHSTKVDE